MENKEYTRRRKWLSGISLAVVGILAVLATLFIGNWFRSFQGEDFRDYIQSFGAAGWLVLLGLQILQVFVAMIPGEVLETGAGYAFGPLWGTVICYVWLILQLAWKRNLSYVLPRRLLSGTPTRVGLTPIATFQFFATNGRM